MNDILEIFRKYPGNEIISVDGVKYRYNKGKPQKYTGSRKADIEIGKKDKKHINHHEPRPRFPKIIYYPPNGQNKKY